MRNNPFGLLAFLHWHHDWNSFHFPEELVKKAADQIQDLGVGMVRMDIVWSDIHVGENQYDFSRYDRLVSLLKRYDFDLLVLLHYNKVRLDDAGKEIWNQPPDSFEEFARYVGATVSHFKHQIRHWEIWNEPNHPIYWTLPPDGLKNYLRLLRLSYQAAKKADPECIVLNGGITEPIIEDVRHFYENGGKDVTDILAIHTFLDPLLPGVENAFDKILTTVQRIMKENGDQNKKVWVTEMGCPGLAQPDSVKNWWAGKNPNEAQQADWVEKQYTMVKKHPFVEKIFWAFYRDTQNMFKDGGDHLGLVRVDLTPKPAFERMKQLIKRGAG